MPTVDQHIAKLDVEMVAGQGRAITFVDLLATTSTVIGDWTAVANGTALAVSASGNDVVVTWSDALATSTIGRTWRLRLSGDDKIGGRVVEARPQTTAGDETVAVTLTDPVEVTVTVAGVAVGAVDSVNGETGVVTLSAADVGADASGTAASAVSSHAAAVDPHGDRAYTDALLAQHIADGTVPTIEYTMTATGVDTYSVTIPNTARAAVYVPPPHDEWPPGDHDGVVEVEPPVDGNTPSWWVVLPTTSPTSFAAAWRDFIDANDHTTVVGAYTDAGALGGVLASQGLYLCHVVPIATPDLLWSGSTPADASTLLDIVAVIAGKEDAGTAAARTGGGLLANRPSAASLTPGARYFAEDDGAEGTDYVVDTSLAWVQAAPPVASVGGLLAIPHVSGEHYSLHGGESSSVACSPSASGELRALPVYLPAGAYDRIGVWVQTAGTSTWRFGVYPCDPTNLWPDGQTLIVDAGTMNMSTTTGYRLLATSFTVTTPGIHWITILTDAYTSRPSVMGWLTSDGATPSDVPWIGSRHLTAGGGRSLWIRSKTGVTTGSMPATFPTSSSWTDQGPQLTVRAT